MEGPEHMETTKKGIILFSGRLNVVHPGHVITILRLCEQHEMVKIVILDYPKRKTPAHWSRDILEEILSHTNHKWQIFINDSHFGKISMEELTGYKPFDFYGAGNMEVINHIKTFEKELDFETKWIDRSWFYEASRYDLTSE